MLRTRPVNTASMRDDPTSMIGRYDSSDISVTETITETEIIDPALTETETMLIYETEII